MAIEFVPRWLWQEVTIPQSGEIVIDPSTFANTTPYPFRLNWLSLCGDVSLGGAPYNNKSGGVLRRLNVEIGITGYSDVNLVPMVGTAFFCPRRQDQKDYLGASYYPYGISLALPRTIRVPRDGGLVVDVQNISDPADEITIYDPSIMAQGYHDESKIPGILAGRFDESVVPGGPHRLNCADLLNNGREDFMMTSLSVDSASAVVEEGRDSTYFTTLTNIAWRINPATGIEWMPQPSPIPVGCLAPFSRPYDLADEGPRAYQFTKNVVLSPRQRLSVKLTEVSAASQNVYVCLHGELEVQ